MNGAWWPGRHGHESRVGVGVRRDTTRYGHGGASDASGDSQFSQQAQYQSSDFAPWPTGQGQGLGPVGLAADCCLEVGVVFEGFFKVLEMY